MFQRTLGNEQVGKHLFYSTVSVGLTNTLDYFWNSLNGFTKHNITLCLDINVAQHWSQKQFWHFTKSIPPLGLMLNVDMESGTA